MTNKKKWFMKSYDKGNGKKSNLFKFNSTDLSSAAPTVSPHRRRKGHQVPFASIDSFSRPKAWYCLVEKLKYSSNNE
nr:hypothetical protein CFP56_53108 [Quercus suber]